MLTSIVLAASLIAAAPDALGAVTSVRDDMSLIRDGIRYRVAQGSGVQNGDVLASPAGGGASVMFRDEALLYLGGETRAVVRKNGPRLDFQLESGEIRVLARGASTCRVTVDQGDILLERGAIRIWRRDRRSHLQLESGSARLRLGGVGRQLRAGDRLAFAQGAIVDAPPKRWSIRASVFKLAALQGVEPPSTPSTTPPSTPSTTPPTTTPPTTPTAPGVAPGAASPPGTAPTTGAEGEAAVATDAEARRRQTGNQADTVAPVSANRFNPRVPGVAGLSLGAFSGTSSVGRSNGTFSDANQQSLQGMVTEPYIPKGGGDIIQPGAAFPGNIHLVTGQTAYTFDQVRLNATEAMGFGNDLQYFSIGTETPTAQVTTDFFTASAPTPNFLTVPRFGDSVIAMEQFGIVDATLDPAGGLNNGVGIPGLVGNPPTAPTITGVTPLEDARAQFNSRATFGLGEIRLRRMSDGSIELAIRRSDQDRRIVKDNGGNDANDQITVNPDVGQFDDVEDPRFLPSVPTVKVPKQDSFANSSTRYSNLDARRRAAITTLMADKLHDYAKRTGQTRFVLRDGGGARILDISGYRK